MSLLPTMHVPFLLFATVLMVAHALHHSMIPLPQSEDPFYTVPAGYEAVKPGTILRLRSAPGNLTTVFNASSSAYNIIYRTTNSQYSPSWAVTTLFVPHLPGKELLSYQIPYNTADADHGPSYALYHELVSNLTLHDINTALDNGWYVNVPDFEGPTASFASGVQEGHAVLDSIRAILSEWQIERYAMWGYSGGSIASEWAAELQVQYAPELNFRGVAIGGVVPNITSLLIHIDGTPAASLIPAALVGLTNQYPEAFDRLLDDLIPEHRSQFLQIRTLSYFEAAQVYANQSILKSFFKDGNSLLARIQEIVNSNGIMGYHGVPEMPAFIYKAIQDEYSPIEDLDKLVNRYCEVGADVLYQRNENGNHLDEYTNGDERALNWLRSVLSGNNTKDIHSGCIIENVNVNITSHGPFAPPT